MSLTSEIRRHFGKDDEGGIKKIQEDIHKVYKDINEENEAECSADIDRICEDLNEIYMDEENETMVIEGIQSLSFYQQYPWFRKAFIKLLSFLEEDYYLRTDAMRRVLDSGWASNETYSLAEDKKADSFVQKLLPDIVEEYYLDVPDKDLEAELLELKRDACIKRFFLARYIIRKPSCLDHIKDRYQYIYGVLEKEVEAITVRPGAYERELEDEILMLSKKAAEEEGTKTFSTTQQLHESLIDTYYRNLTSEYPLEADELKAERDRWKNVRGNDPCPCGSGKKFKKCHGA